MDSDQCITKLKRILSYYKFEFHYSKEIQSEPQFEATIRYFKEKVNLQLYHYDHNVCYGYYIIQILKTAYCFADIFQTDTKGFDHHLNIFLNIVSIFCEFNISLSLLFIDILVINLLNISFTSSLILVI